MDERTEAEVKRTLDVLAPIVTNLRERGYDASAWVELRGDHFTVDVRVRVPPLATPIERLN